MPKFDLLSLDVAKVQTATARGAGITREYVEYIIEVRATGKAGKLTPVDGESAAAIRRRLGVAAKPMGVDLAIKRAGDEVYFWLRAMEGKKRRGQPK